MSVPFLRGRFPCNVAAHCVAEVLIRLKACVFSRVLSESPILCKAFNGDTFPKTRAAKKSPCWQLHFMASSTSILSLVFVDEVANGAKSEWSSIGTHHSSIEGTCLFPRPLRVCLLCKALKRDNFPKTRAADKNPGRQLHFMASSTSILSLVFSDEAATAQSGGRSAPPLSSFERWRERRRLEKFQHTLADREGHLFQFWCSVLENSEAYKSSPSLFSSSMPPPESGSPLILVGFAVFNRRVMQLASRGECDRAWAGSSLVDFECSFFFFFFGIFGKSYARRQRETKKIITVALSFSGASKRASWCYEFYALHNFLHPSLLSVSHD